MPGKKPGPKLIARFVREEWARAIRKLTIFADRNNPTVKIKIQTGLPDGGGNLWVGGPGDTGVALAETEAVDNFAAMFSPRFLRECLAAFKPTAKLEMLTGDSRDKPMILRDAEPVNGRSTMALLMPIKDEFTK